MYWVVLRAPVIAVLQTLRPVTAWSPLPSPHSRAAAEGVLALSAAAEVFLSAVCAKATAAAAAGKRRTVRLDDMEKCIRGDKRLMAAGFTAVINMVSAAAATEAEGKAAAVAAAGAPPGKKQKVDKAAAPAAGADKHNSIEKAFGMAS